MPTKRITESYLRRRLQELDGGVLSEGMHHNGDRAFCALEFVNMEKHGRWVGDYPEEAGMPDFRDLNDHFWDSERRTRALLPVLVAYWRWARWSTARQLEVHDRFRRMVQRRRPSTHRWVNLSHPDLGDVAASALRFLRPETVCRYLVRATESEPDEGRSRR